MGIFLEKKVAEYISQCNNKISALWEKEAAGIRNMIDVNIEVNDEQFLVYSIVSFWGRFYSLYENNADHFDASTRFNQYSLGNRILFFQEDVSGDKLLFLSNVCRVLYEYAFMNGMDIQNSVYETVINANNLNKLVERFGNAPENRQQFAWIRDVMPIAIAQYIITQGGFTDVIKIAGDIKTQVSEIEGRIVEKFDDSVSTIKSEKEKIINYVDGAKKEVNKHLDSKMAAVRDIEREIAKSRIKIDEDKDIIKELEKVISNYRSEFNFVGLSHAFAKIRKVKVIELRDAVVWYRNIGGLIFIAPLVAFSLHFIMPSLFSKGVEGLFLFLPLVTIEIVLFYFFRLSYLESKSIKTQILQIDVRLSLCAFIHSYIDFRKENGGDISELLKCFDTMIFSPIQAVEGNIPSMFDGSEAIANFLSKVVTGKGQ